MNGLNYVELLREKLTLHMAIHKTTIFMQDGAPCHRSKVVKEFLMKNRVKVLDWPGNSPDLNPIENLWSQMKDLVAEKQPPSAAALVAAIKDVWVKEIKNDYCASLVASVPRRLQAVMDARRGHTKY